MIRAGVIGVGAIGKHHARVYNNLDSVLVEKPIASTVTEGQDIIERAATSGLILTVGHVERFNPALVELKRRLLDAVTGVDGLHALVLARLLITSAEEGRVLCVREEAGRQGWLRLLERESGL